MTLNPSFSVVIPTYNRRDVVREAVRAIDRVEYDGEVEIIVAIDGSTDDTAEALEQIECRFALHTLRLPHGGAAHARNQGAAQASNDILLFLDDDMMSQPDLLQEHARMYEDGADAVIGDVLLDADSAPGFLSESNGRWLNSRKPMSVVSPFEVFTGQLSVRKRVFDELGGFDHAYTAENSFSSEDSDLGVRLAESYELRHNPQAITRQRYVVNLREFLARAPAAATGHLHFAQKHPRHRRELLNVVGQSKPLVRYVYRPLSRIPLLPQALSRVALVIGELGLRTPLRSSRTLARFVSGARTISYWSALRAGGGLPEGDKLLVLGYHAIEDLSADPILARYGVPPAEFADHLDSLSSRGFRFIGPDLAASFLAHGTPLPRRAVLLTFDDCYSGLLSVARDVLRPRGIEAIAFAVTKAKTNEWDQEIGARAMRLLNKDELVELASLGVEIGSHSRSHREMPELRREECIAEAAGSSDDLAASGLIRPRFFAFPYGARDDQSVSAVKNAGYLAAFSADDGIVSMRSNRFELPRIIVHAGDRGWRFLLRTAFPQLFDGAEIRLRRVAKALSNVSPTRMA